MARKVLHKYFLLAEHKVTGVMKERKKEKKKEGRKERRKEGRERKEGRKEGRKKKNKVYLGIQDLINSKPVIKTAC